MMLNKATQLEKNEQMIYDLRAMYAEHGYSQFRIRRFEEYELYVKNKDFLDSVNIITFTDTNGKLMALKPDVTLSVVKNSRDIPGVVQKVYYNENIYRISHRSHMFEELTQVGIECIGDLDDYNLYEVLMLAARTLQKISAEGILVISNLDIVLAVLEYYDVSEDVQEILVECLGEKNSHTIRRICGENEVHEDCVDILCRMARIYGHPSSVLPMIRQLIAEKKEELLADRVEMLITGMENIFDAFRDADLRDMIRIDFSVVSDMSYYNGIVFNGFVEGLPECIISGGQYDRLMKKMKRMSKAIGFGVYMDRMERLLTGNREYDIDVLLLYDVGTPVEELNDAVDTLIREGNRVLAQRSVPPRLRWGRVLRLREGKVTEDE